MPKVLRIAGLALLALGLVGASPLLAQESDEADIRAEIEILKQGQQAMRKQLNEIKQLLQQQQAKAAPAGRPGPQVKDVVFDLGSNEIKGSADAGLTLIEFTDYQ